MDRFIELLFNPNHEMPSGWVLAVLVAIGIIVPTLMRWIQDSRSSRKKDISTQLLASEPAKRPKKPRTKTTQKKKKKK